MERIGYVRAVQGGGGGVGFNTPKALQFDEPLMYHSLIRKIAKRSNEAVRNCRGASHEERMKIWNSALMKKLYLIHGIRNVLARSDYTCSDGEKKNAGPPGTSRDNNSQSERSSSTRCHWKKSSLFSVDGDSNADAGFPHSIDYLIRPEESDGLIRRQQNENLVIHQFIPRLPKNIEEVLFLWRFGSEKSLGFPLRRYRDAKFRHENIFGYSDKKWRRGQRQLFERYKKLVQALSLCVSPPISNIYADEDEDSQWDAAVEHFKSQWSDVSWSTVINSMRRTKDCIREETSENERFKILTEQENLWFKSHTEGEETNTVVIQVEPARIGLRRYDIRTLIDDAWVNDEIVNSFAALVNCRNRTYFQFLKTRCTPNYSVQLTSCEADQSRPRAFMFNSFFFSRLVGSSTGYCYTGVRSWTEKIGIDIKSLELILFPVNLNNEHWILATIDIRRRQFNYYDSRKGPDNFNVLRSLKRWFFDEMKAKNVDCDRTESDMESWSIVVNPPHSPQQIDYSSCGIFMLYTADYLELAKKFDFSQEQISILRKRTALFLDRNKLADSLDH